MNLCRVLERGGEMAASARFLGALTHRDYPWLTPPPADYEVTVNDLLKAADTGAFETAYAKEAWDAWSANHAAVRRWLDVPQSLPPQRSLR